MTDTVIAAAGNATIQWDGTVNFNDGGGFGVPNNSTFTAPALGGNGRYQFNADIVVEITNPTAAPEGINVQTLFLKNGTIEITRTEWLNLAFVGPALVGQTITMAQGKCNSRKSLY